MANEFYMMAGQFETTAGAATKLSEIPFDFYNDPERTPDLDKDGNYKKTAPQLQIADAVTDISRTLWYAKLTKGSTTTYGWTAGTKFEDSTIDAGIGFWFRDPLGEAPNFTFSGQVIPDSPWTRTFPTSDFYMLANPFPRAYDVCNENDILISGLKDTAPTLDQAGNYKKVATQIQVPTDKSDLTKTCWYVKLTKGSTTTYGWTAGSKFETSLVVPAGRACWFKPAVADTTVQFFE